MININYPSELISILQKSKFHYIPRIIEKDSELLKFRKYYCYDFIKDSYFKVRDIFEVDHILYAELSFSDTTFWCIPARTGNYTIYELLLDNAGLLSDENIINSRRWFYGYEIKYWFFLHYKFKYREFKPYLEDNSPQSIDNEGKYFLNGDYKNNRYTNCKFTKKD